MAKYRLATWIVVALIFIGMACSLLVPSPPENDWLIFHGYFAVALGTAIAFVGAAVIFIMSMDAFTDKLRKSYRLICFSLVMLGLAFAHLPFMLYLVDFSTYWKDNSITAPLFIISLITVYAGARSLAKLFGINNFITNPWWQLAGAFSFTIIFVLIPHVATSTPEIKLQSSIAGTALSVYNMGMSAILIYQIKRVASVMYTNALAWMTLSYGICAIGGTLVNIAIKALGDQQWYLIGAFPLIPLFIGGIFMLRAAYSFNSIAASASDTQGWVARNFFGKPLSPRSDKAPNAIDIIIYASTLVSNPRSIDPILDQLRQITARRHESGTISAEDEAHLRAIYLQIESYLISEEPIRKFTKESLRQSIAQKLLLTEATSTNFWKAV